MTKAATKKLPDGVNYAGFYADSGMMGHTLHSPRPVAGKAAGAPSAHVAKCPEMSGNVSICQSNAANIQNEPNPQWAQDRSLPPVPAQSRLGGPKRTPRRSAQALKCREMSRNVLICQSTTSIIENEPTASAPRFRDSGSEPMEVKASSRDASLMCPPRWIGDPACSPMFPNVPECSGMFPKQRNTQNEPNSEFRSPQSAFSS